MNDQLQKALADLLAKANQGIDAGASFLQAQLPDVIQQLLWWKAVSSIVCSIAGVVLLGAVGFIWWRILRAKLPDMDDFILDGMVPCFMGALVSIPFVGIGIAAISLDWLQILIAPKVYLIEHAAHLAK